MLRPGREINHARACNLRVERNSLHLVASDYYEALEVSHMVLQISRAIKILEASNSVILID